MQFHYQQKDRNKKVEINLLTLLRLPKISNQWEEYKWEPEEHSVDTWLRYMQCTGLQIRGRCLSCKREWVFEPWFLHLTWLSLVNHFTLNQAELVWTASLTIDLKFRVSKCKVPLDSYLASPLRSVEQPKNHCFINLNFDFDFAPVSERKGICYLRH